MGQSAKYPAEFLQSLTLEELEGLAQPRRNRRIHMRAKDGPRTEAPPPIIRLSKATSATLTRRSRLQNRIQDGLNARTAEICGQWRDTSGKR